MEEKMENKHFQKAQKKASGVLKDKSRLKALLLNSTNKLKSIGLGKIKFEKLTERVMIIIRLIRAYVKGEYRALPWKSILILVAALIYFVTPLDLIPDFIPVSGLIDDLTVVLWVFKTLEKEINAFLAWENTGKLPQ